MKDIFPVLLCGGAGTRLWPLSRKSYPKQFSVTWGDHTLYQQSALRTVGPGFKPPTIVTAEAYRFIASEQLHEMDLASDTLLVEPSSKNTAPAILAATLRVMQQNPDAILLVAPTDHLIPDVAAFQETIRRAEASASAGNLVTFGIEPDRAETGYGYLKLGKAIEHSLRELEAFVEKPSSTDAQVMLDSGGYLWNAGIFLFSGKSLIKAFEEQAPEILNGVRLSLDNAQNDLDFTRLESAAWEKLPSISIDYAIMEKADNLTVAPYTGAWSDLGDWQAIHRELPSDDNGMVLTGASTAIDCKNSMLRAESDSQQVVGIGLENILVVAMPDAVLVADTSCAQNVKQAVTILKENRVKQAEDFSRDNRPWGWYETLALSDRFQVKRIVVKPGGCLSLQSHFHRSEHWIVVAGTAKVTIDDDVKLVTENESVYIPLGAVHRMENPGKLPMVLIEVQTGTYLGEDDIVRYEDIYARN
ncbi:MAG: mannose-1-phosphate guanylyltransferase/mannose-6-phosphate isomerase [Granulosicoccus sp.]